MDNPEELDEVLKKFVECGANLNEESTVERSALGLLAKATHKKGTLNALKYLIEQHNLDPSGGPHSKKAPLINACTHGDLEMIEYLLSKKANPNSVVKGIGYMEGVSCLQAVLSSKSFEGTDKSPKRKAVEMLMKAGAKPTDKVK